MNVTSGPELGPRRPFVGSVFVGVGPKGVGVVGPSQNVRAEEPSSSVRAVKVLSRPRSAFLRGSRDPGTVSSGWSIPPSFPGAVDCRVSRSTFVRSRAGLEAQRSATDMSGFGGCGRAGREPGQFDHRVVAWEVSAVLDDLAQLVVQRLDGVAGVDDPAQLGRDGQERGEPFPRRRPRSGPRADTFWPRSEALNTSSSAGAASGLAAV